MSLLWYRTLRKGGLTSEAYGRTLSHILLIIHKGCCKYSYENESSV